MGHYSDSYEADADRAHEEQTKTNKAVWKNIDKLTDKIRAELDKSDIGDDEHYMHALMRLREFEFWAKELLTR